MHFGVLGPITVSTDAGEPVTVPGTKVRALLADLLVNRNRVVSADRLIDDLWGDRPPANAAGALQVRVSQLRKALNDAEPGARDLVESHPPGYLLRAAAVDADRFAELTGADDVDRLTEALRLWRGDPYADVADEHFVRAEVDRLTEQRLAVRERLAEARLARGEPDLVVADLAELVAGHPLRESLRALQLRALYAAGRQADALDSYADLRRRLADELGLDPGPELVTLHRRILDQDAGLSVTPRAAPVRAGLPPPLTELVGRAEALAEVRRLLADCRLVTLVGPGGVGKTRLAVEAARDRAAQLIELAALPAGDPEPAEVVLAALDVREPPGAGVDAADRLVAVLRSRRVVLVLDNCEHVIEPVAALVARLLRDAPEATVLATSREPLGLTGERIWEVPPLGLPDDDRDVAAVRRSPAARLFAARAAAQQRTFRLDERTAPAVAQLCRRLDGLPLALELAATRVRQLGVAGVVERLDDRFAVLSTRQRDLPARQRTLTAVIGWSWDLLEPADRHVLARLAVFRDGCTAAAAEAVCGADIDVLARLVDRSLVVLDDHPAGPRYRLLESVAAFCLDRLDDPDTIRQRHAAYYTELAERADPQLRGAEQREWLDRLDAEAANLRAALPHGGPRLVNALTWYWFLRGRYAEAHRALAGAGDAAWRAGFALLQGVPVNEVDVPDRPRGRLAWFLARALIERSDLARAAELLDAAMAGADTWTEAAVLSSRAMLAHAAGDLAALERDGRRSDELFAAIGDRWGRLQASDWIGGLAEMRGDHDRAAAVHAEGLRWAEELALWPHVCGKLSWLAWLAVQVGDYSQAREMGERAYGMAVEQGSPAALAFAELGLGFAARRDGKLDLAATHLEHLVEIAGREEQPTLYLPMVLTELGRLAEQCGDPATALARYLAAFEAAQATIPGAAGPPRDTVGPVEGVASVLPDPELAACLLGAAAAVRTASATAADPIEREVRERTTARLVATLGEDAFRAAYQAGGAVDLAEVMRRAGTTR